MDSAKYTRSIHIDADVEQVFHYLEDPAHFIAAMPADHHATVGAVHRTPEGVVTTYECNYRELGTERPEPTVSLDVPLFLTAALYLGAR